MLDDNDLRAISRILDEKLLPIKSDIQELKTDVQELKTDVKVMKVDIQELKEGMEEVRGSVSSIVDWIDEAEHEVNIKFPVKNKIN